MTLQAQLAEISEGLNLLDGINEMLALPSEYQDLVKGKRCPLQNHFGETLHPIPSNFDTGQEQDFSIQLLARALIDPDCLRHGLGSFYLIMPSKIRSHNKTNFDPETLDQDLVLGTLVRFMLYDYACLHNFGMPYKRLLAEVGMQTQGAIFKMVQVDKSFLAGPYGSSLIIKKQHEADWKFFEKLGEAIKKMPVNEPVYMFKAKLVVAYFWDEHFSKMPYPEIVRVLKKEKVLPKMMPPENFRKMLNRVGLQKPQYNKKN